MFIKDIIKKAIQPFTRPVWDRIWGGVDVRFSKPIHAHLGGLEGRVGAVEGRIGAVEGRLAPFEARVAQFETGWRQHVPAFLNAVSTVRSFGFELSKRGQEVDELRDKIRVFGEFQHKSESSMDECRKSLDECRKSLDECRKSLDEISKEFREFAGNVSNDIPRIWQRIEFVRRELLYEFNYRRNTSATTIPSDAKSRVIDDNKFAEAKANGLRINLGCGPIPLEGYINVDQRELPGVDVVADAGDLPIEPGTAHEIFSSHLVEHFPQEMLRRNLLPYWKTLLAPGGLFRAIVPDGEAMLTRLAAGTYSFEDFREVLFGSQDYNGDFHLNLLTPDSFTVLLQEAGFTDITVPVKARRNWRCFEFEICALHEASTRQDLAASPAAGREQTKNA
jgi:hypothetical protein